MRVREIIALDGPVDGGARLMANDELLVIPANRRYLWSGVVLSTVFVAGAFAFAPSSSRATRIALYVCRAVFAAATVLGLLRLRMARVPQLVADDDAFKVATLFARRTFVWSDIERVEPTYFSVPFRGRVRKRRRIDIIYGEVPNQFRFRARGRLYAVMAPPQGCASLDAARDEFERMWRGHARDNV